MRAIFVTATGTEIGKTFVATGLLASLRRRGRDAAALKPVVSGFDPTTFDSSDPALLLQASGRPCHLAAIAAIAPWRFAAPLSPDMAAAREDRTIDFAALVRFCRDAIDATEDMLIIEGIGGLLVPLTATSTIVDLIEALKVPILLVAGTYLGTLSHALSALEVARRRGITVAAVVLNETPDSHVSVAATRDSLMNFCGPLPIIAIQRRDGEDLDAFDRLADIVAADIAGDG